MQKVESVLKDLIEFGFADHVDESLLKFDKNGKLNQVINANSKPTDQQKLQFPTGK